MVLSKYLSNFWRTLEIPLINCEIFLFSTWSKKCILVAGIIADQEPTFTITDTKLHVPVFPVILSTHDNVKLSKQLESGFKITTDWNKYQSKITEQSQNRYLDFLTGLSFQGVYRLFVLSSENRTKFHKVTSDIFFQL